MNKCYIYLSWEESDQAGYMTLIVVRTALVIQSLPIDKYNREGKIDRY